MVYVVVDGAWHFYTANPNEARDVAEKIQKGGRKPEILVGEPGGWVSLEEYERRKK